MDLLVRLQEEQREAIDLVTTICASAGIEVYLVGGAVRDLILGAPFRDLDFSVPEGYASVALQIGESLESKVEVNERFLTATVESRRGRIDVNTQRAETYPSPGALPVVRPGSLIDDLRRRDFSVNSMAVNLGSGELIDPCGGTSDLDACLIRALHSRSFLDDPTRIWRAYRFAERLGFEIEETTRAWMRSALETNSQSHVSDWRLRRELELAALEPSAKRTLETLAREGVVNHLLGKVAIARLNDALEDSARAIEIAPGLDRSAIFIGALIAASEDPEASTSRLALSAGQRWVGRLFPTVNERRPQLAHSTSDREVLEIVRGLPAEAIALLAVHERAGAAFFERWSAYETFDAGVRGTALGLAPGPHIGWALERTKEALFLGEIEASGAVAFAHDEALKYLSRQK